MNPRERSAGCAGDTTLGALESGTLSAEDRARLEVHLDVCEQCSTVVAELSRMSAQESAPDDGARVLGRYVLLRRIGIGGMGEVFSAYDPQLDRRVALKLLRDDLPRQEGSGNLLLEAQAMARLSHPNVVSVYDAGEVEHRGFVAMELVEGKTLTRWLRETPRPQSEVLAVFQAAGRGLSAAHQAGLVHRDFKPDNVLIGADGRPRVADFGLALPAPAQWARETVKGDPATPNRAPGTPAYMAPEQLEGLPADARSDQYSFCVALFEALHGERPSLAAPARTSVDPRLLQVLLQGLSKDPAQRHASMLQLLLALESVADRRKLLRRRWAAAALLGLLALGGAAELYRRRHVCGGGEERLAGIWDAGSRESVRQALIADGRPLSARIWHNVERSFDAYAASWVSMRQEACKATKVRHVQSDEVLALRMDCLDSRLVEWKELVTVLGGVRGSAVVKADDAAQELLSIAGCANLGALRRAGRAPADRGSRARLEGKLARVRALLATAQYEDTLAAIREVVGDASHVKDRRMMGRAFLLEGAAHRERGDFAHAEQLLFESLLAAQVAEDPETQVRAATALAFVVGTKLRRFPEGSKWTRQGRAVLESLGEDVDLQVELLRVESTLRQAEGRLAEALTLAEQALQLLRRTSGAATRTADAQHTLANAKARLGRRQEATSDYQAAVATLRAEFGAEHPHVAYVLANLGENRRLSGEYPQASADLRESLHILQGALPSGHLAIANALSKLGTLEVAIGRYTEGLELFRRALPYADPVLEAQVLSNTAAALDRLGRGDEAVDVLRRALRIQLDQLGDEHPHVAHTRAGLSILLREQHKPREALEHARAALAISEKAIGSSSPGLTRTLVPLAEVWLELGRPAAALPLLERAQRLMENERIEPGKRAQLLYVFAKVLWARGGEQVRARRLAEEALATLKDMPAAQAGKDRRTISAWLAQSARK